MNTPKQTFEEKVWQGIYMLVHHLRVDIQQNPVVSTRAANKLERDFNNKVRDLVSTAHNQAVAEAYNSALTEARAVVLRRTEIPKDARNPTRDHIVILGEEIAGLIAQLTPPKQGEGK